MMKLSGDVKIKKKDNKDEEEAIKEEASKMAELRRQKQELQRKKQQLVSEALKSIDDPNARSTKRIVFDSDSEEDTVIAKVTSYFLNSYTYFHIYRNRS